jgi:hypothetical protein
MTVNNNALSDYQKWKNANDGKNFSLYDYIHCVAIEKKIPIDFNIALLKLFYPEFIVIENHVFLKEEYDESEYLRLIEQNLPKKEVEYWMNLLNINSLFYSEEIEAENDSLYIDTCEVMANLWSQKLHKDFPEKQFYVGCLKDDNEMYIVFYEQI